MYDVLLDDLDDEGTPSPDEAVELSEKDGLLDADDGLADDLLAVDADADLDIKPEELLLGATGEGESWSDDPVRIYLTQMG